MPQSSAANHVDTTAPLVDDFKLAMRHLTAGVTVVTAGEDEARRGLTVSAACSVSVQPPTILVCVNRFGEAHQAIVDAGAFCVNLLSRDDEPAALMFAGQGELRGMHRFDPFAWSQLATGAPALDGALANIDCRIAAKVDAGTHTVFLGAVEAVRCDPAQGALAYFDRHFVKL